MHVQKVVDEIQKSIPSLGSFNTATADGFARRLFRQYGVAPVLYAVKVSGLDPLHAEWIRRRSFDYL